MLTVRTNQCVYYGDSIQLVAPGPDCCTTTEQSRGKNLCQLAHLALSASVSINELDFKPFLDTDSIITVSPHLYPVVRNCFVIEQLSTTEKFKVLS